MSPLDSGSNGQDDFNLSTLFEALLLYPAAKTKANGAGNAGDDARRETSEVGGENIGQFHATKVLGTGAFAVVKLATHNVTRRKVALKIMPKKLIVDMGAQEHVAREIWHLQMCSAHPHLSKLYDVIDSPETTILALELGWGEILQYMAGRSLAPDEARKFFQQMVSALEFMQYKGVVHRDLKLENVLLDASRTMVKIVDFGLSNMVKEGELMTTTCGSPHHAAPEVICGKPYFGPPVDIWSSGVILYAMLVGDLPFRGKGENAEGLFEKIQSGEFWMPPYLSWGMKELIQGMICVDPKKRLTIKEIRKKDWFKQNLPQYLCRTPEETETEERHTLDPAVVEEVMTLYDMHSVEPVKRSQIEEAAEAEDLTVELGAEEETRTIKDIQLSYRLVLDGERAKKLHIKKTIMRKEPKKKKKKPISNLLLRGRFM